MVSYELGELIRKLREERGLTQEQLGEGLYSQKSMSKIESGEQIPREAKFEALMQRLGLCAENYYRLFLGAGDFEAFQKRRELINLIADRQYGKAELLINQLQNIKSFSSGLNLQLILNSKGILARVYNNPDKAMEYFNQSIHMTKKNFDEKEISTYLLSFQETTALNLLANLYADQNNLEKAIEILYSIKTSMDKCYSDEYEKSKIYPLIIYNLTKYLGVTERFRDSIKICREGLEICVRQNKYAKYPKILFNQVWCLNKLGNKEECLRLLPVAYNGLKMVEDYESAERAKKYAKDELGVELM